MKIKNLLTKILLSITFITAFAFTSNTVLAQVKIGSNPGTIGGNVNLEVESNTGNKTIIRKDNGNVGIGTTTPTAKLHVAGNQVLGTAPVINESTGTSQLVRDNATGEIKVLRTTTENSYPISSITFQLNNVAADWVADFDTRISATDYVVIITGLIYNGSNLKNDSSGDNSGYNPLNFQAFIRDGTWRLMADYDGGSPSTTINGKWTINCLVINSSIIQQLPTKTKNMGGQSTGALIGPPAGL